MTEFQAAILQAQMTRLNEQASRRDENAKFLTGLLGQTPGITPARMYPGCTRNAYHLYMFRYDKEAFAGLPRKTFIKALAAEGIPCSGGYDPLNKEPFVRDMVKSRPYRMLYPANVIESWAERTACPQNDRLCTEAVWLTQNMLLGTKSDMEQIGEAVRKIQTHASALLTS
jgi:dTDP-4-amino-4,6-dideoxygalactose transaminase